MEGHAEDAEVQMYRGFAVNSPGYLILFAGIILVFQWICFGDIEELCQWVRPFRFIHSTIKEV